MISNKGDKALICVIVSSFCLLSHSSVCPLPTQVFCSTSTTLLIRVGLSLRVHRYLLNALSKKWPAVFFSISFEPALLLGAVACCSWWPCHEMGNTLELKLFFVR